MLCTIMYVCSSIVTVVSYNMLIIVDFVQLFIDIIIIIYIGTFVFYLLSTTYLA